MLYFCCVICASVATVSYGEYDADTIKSISFISYGKFINAFSTAFNPIELCPSLGAAFDRVDIPVLLNSTPEETKNHRRSRARDGKVDSAFTTMVLEIEQEMLDKIGYVADYEGRSVNSHVLVLIRENIKAFEAEHGVIEGTIRPDVNVKPAGKARG